MRKSERLFEIIAVLRRERQPVSAAAIAAELAVSKRTIYRDMEALMNQGVPVLGEAGVGYVLGEGFDMPPLTLTPNEVDAAVLGAAWVATRGERELGLAARSLLAKLEAVAPAHLRPLITQPSTSVRPASRVEPDGVDSQALREAIRARRKIDIRYVASDGVSSQRIIWPVLLGYRDEGRILAAWCETREAFRFFRTDRMTSAVTLDQAIPERADLLRKRWRAAMDEERDRFKRKASR